MEPRTSRNYLSLNALVFCLILICSLCVVSAFAGTGSNIVVRENVTQKKREQLANKLRSISGFKSLKFDRDGTLQLGPTANGGSSSARELLLHAVNGDSVIVIEDASSSSEIAFCRVVPGKWRGSDGIKVAAFVVMIDFDDFRQVSGDDEARAAFDVGWGFLHELDHIVSNHEDADEPGLVGDCENHINTMRQELALPVRAEYFFSQSALRSDPNFNSNFVRLAFEKRDAELARTRRYWLVWDATAVGGVALNRQTASVQSMPKFQTK
jgi:hypothetical protein